MIPRAARSALEEALEDRIRFGVPLAKHTSLRVGGPADALATPADRAELSRLLALCAAHRIPHWVLGAGFNTLVLDGGAEGVAIQLSRLRRLEERPGGALRAEAGISHARLTRFCVERGLAGLEFGAGIPGTVGGWTAMNAGIGQREVKDAVLEVEVMSPTGAWVRHLSRDTLRFTYRALRGLAPGSVIVSTLFGVTPSTAEAVRAVIEPQLARRSATQPPGDFAGRLIEAAGLKGLRVGGAEISTVHANFIVNRGGAQAADVVGLIERVRTTVRELTGRTLELEVRIVGRRP